MAKNGQKEMSSIPINNDEGFQGMRNAGSLAAKVLDNLSEIIRPGISTEDINSYCHKMIESNGAIPAPLNYRGYPKSVCTSVNHVVCHGIPNENKI